MSDCAQPILQHAAEGRVLECLGTRCIIRVPSAATGGAMAMVEVRVPPGDGPPMHLHRREEEGFHVLEGCFRFWCGDRAWTGGQGATVLLPRGVPHTFRNIGDAPGRLLVTLTPGGFEGFFEGCAARGLRVPENAAELVALGAEFDLEFTGPPPPMEDGIAVG